MDKNVNRDRLIRYVHAAEADDKLLELLKCAENGETIIITRHGRSVAHLTPPDEERERELRKEVEMRFREYRSKLPKAGMTAEEINELVRGRD